MERKIEDFHDWCESMGGSHKWKDSDDPGPDQECEIYDADDITVNVDYIGQDHASGSWIEREGVSFDHEDLENGHPKDPVVSTKDDSVIVSGKTGYHGRGEMVSVVINGDVSVVDERSGEDVRSELPQDNRNY